MKKKKFFARFAGVAVRNLIGRKWFYMYHVDARIFAWFHLRAKKTESLSIKNVNLITLNNRVFYFLLSLCMNLHT